MNEKITLQILDKLNEISLWLKFANRQALKELVETTLRDERDKEIYRLTDGNHSTTEISKHVKCSQPTISNIWNRWKKIGIVVEINEIQGRCKALCSLEELGLDK